MTEKEQKELIQELRKTSKRYTDLGYEAIPILLIKAADEIKRLQKEVENRDERIDDLHEHT